MAWVVRLAGVVSGVLLAHGGPGSPRHIEVRVCLSEVGQVIVVTNGREASVFALRPALPAAARVRLAPPCFLSPGSLT